MNLLGKTQEQFLKDNMYGILLDSLTGKDLEEKGSLALVNLGIILCKPMGVRPFKVKDFFFRNQCYLFEISTERRYKDEVSFEHDGMLFFIRSNSQDIGNRLKFRDLILKHKHNFAVHKEKVEFYNYKTIYGLPKKFSSVRQIKNILKVFFEEFPYETSYINYERKIWIGGVKQSATQIEIFGVSKIDALGIGQIDLPNGILINFLELLNEYISNEYDKEYLTRKINQLKEGS